MSNIGKEGIDRAIALILAGRKDIERRNSLEAQQKRDRELAEKTALEAERMKKENEIRAHQDLVRKTGVVEVWEGLVEKGVVGEKTEMVWDKNGLGVEFRFHIQHVNYSFAYSFIRAELVDNELMLNGTSSNRMGVVEALAQSIVSPRDYWPEREHNPGVATL